jgi:S1-C subfamily serine protease
LITRSNLSQLAVALQGLPVYGCLPGSPAERAGVRYGDVLLSVDGYATPSWDAYIAARERSGASILLRLFRDGQELEVEVPLDRDMHLDADALAATLGMLAHTSAPPPPGKPD